MTIELATLSVDQEIFPTQILKLRKHDISKAKALRSDVLESAFQAARRAQRAWYANQVPNPWGFPEFSDLPAFWAIQIGKMIGVNI
jgi:hypothetical protein